MPASLSELEQQPAALLKRISDLGDLHPGSITGTGDRCGNPGVPRVDLCKNRREAAFILV